MQKNYVYKSVILHAAVVLLCLWDIPFLSGKRNYDEQPPIIVDLENITISDTTNIPEKAVRGEEKKPATRKEKPVTENAAKQQPEQLAEPEIPLKEEQKPDPVIDTPEIKAPSLIEETPKKEELKEEPKKETEKKPVKEKRKPAPIPQKKPKIQPVKKVEPKKKPLPKNDKKAAVPAKETAKIKTANPLESLMNSVDDLQKQIGEEDTPAQIPYDEPVNNMGIEGGNSKGSYFSELSVSGIDFVKSKIQESWKTVAGDKKDVEVVISVKLTKEGLIQSVDIEDMSRYRSDMAFQALADSAERAIHIAQDVHGVFKVLASQNSSNYGDWKEIRFTFTPLGLSR